MLKVEVGLKRKAGKRRMKWERTMMKMRLETGRDDKRGHNRGGKKGVEGEKG